VSPQTGGPAARRPSDPQPSDPRPSDPHPSDPQPSAEYACARVWAALTTAHALITEHLGAALQEACGLSINEFELLLRLQAGPGGQGQRLGRLNAAVRITQPSVSRAVARMETRGWLRRTSTPDDGRAVLITITAAGREKLRTAVPVHAAAIREFLLDQLTPDEHDALTRALTRVAEAGATRIAAGRRRR
jgi:DNA-binding MarR family transcriptional regulator